MEGTSDEAGVAGPVTVAVQDHQRSTNADADAMIRPLLVLAVVWMGAVGAQPAAGQFVETFADDEIDSWKTQTGDGAATVEVAAVDGHALLTVDATEDRHNIWWAVLQRDVSAALDLERVQEPTTELRVTARLRVGHAPRRVNLSLNTQRTTNFHRHLMEFDVPDTTGWHTISMTTDGFDARPGDTVNAQLALIDWGPRQYQAGVDSFAVERVSAVKAGTTLGRAVPYPLPVRTPDSLSHHLPVSEAALVNRGAPDVRLASWAATEESARVPTWTVTTDQYLLLRWEHDALPSAAIDGPGVLELTRYSVQQVETTPEELGQVRVVEITGGSSSWADSSVTYAGFTEEQPLFEVLNPQPIVDLDVSGPAGQAVRIPVSEPVLRRLQRGETKGLALRPLGPVSASFLAGDRFTPTLHLEAVDTEL